MAKLIKIIAALFARLFGRNKNGKDYYKPEEHLGI